MLKITLRQCGKCYKKNTFRLCDSYRQTIQCQRICKFNSNELKLISWKGKGIKSKCFDEKGRCIIECDKEYFRPLEVDTLLGNSRKALKELKWKPKIHIKQLVKEMVESETSSIKND